MSTQIAQTIKQNTHEKLEQLKQQSVEGARENFTKLPGFLIEQFLGIPQAEDHSKAKNFTPFNEQTREKMGESFSQQDGPKLDATRESIEALKAQMAFVNKEVEEAKEYFKIKEEERKKKELEEQEEERAIAIQQSQASMAGGEPGTKAKRGQMKQKKPDTTMENRAATGKQ